MIETRIRVYRYFPRQTDDPRVPLPPITESWHVDAREGDGEWVEVASGRCGMGRGQVLAEEAEQAYREGVAS